MSDRPLLGLGLVVLLWTLLWVIVARRKSDVRARPLRTGIAMLGSIGAYFAFPGSHQFTWLLLIIAVAFMLDARLHNRGDPA